MSMSYTLPTTTIQYKVNKEKRSRDLVMQEYPVSYVHAFQEYILIQKHLKVATYIPEMDEDFFLVASTGLGKTLGVPDHELLRQWELCFQESVYSSETTSTDFPRLWVIEPKILIVEAQMEYMNSLYGQFIQTMPEGECITSGASPELFGCQTSILTHNTQAPIKFVTTGIFPIAVDRGWIVPGRDRVLIDEAHITIDSEEKVELIIARCRKKGIPIDYMSATCDTTGLKETLGVKKIINAVEKQKPLWIHNMARPMEECIVDLVTNTLITPDYSSDFFPQGIDQESREIRETVMQKSIAKGMLIVVNSFSGEQSDANKVAKLIEDAPFNNPKKRINVFLLSGKIIKDKRLKRRFDDQVAECI